MGAIVVCVFVAAVSGCGSDDDGVKPQNTSPTASFVVTPESGTVQTVFQFDASGSADTEDSTSVLQVRWDWESDGTWDIGYSTAKSAMHQYATAGTKTVKLEVRDTEGLSDTETHTVTVTVPNTAPTACFAVDPAEGTTATTFGFDAGCCTDTEDLVSALEVRWDWEDDGTWDTGYSTAKSATHQYGTAGTKTIRVEVKDTGGLTGTTTRTVTVDSGPPPGFVLIQPGTFTMGSPSGELCRDSGETQHQVTLTRAIYVAATEVTQAQWQATMGWEDSYFDGPNLPVEQVTWFDAVSYCNLRSAAEGLTPVYTITGAEYDENHIGFAGVTWNPNANGYRLLTEAEWEYACRADSTGAFCNGDIGQCHCGSEPNLGDVGWYCGNSGDQTHDVGTKSPNAWGLYDMHGNVWEWCWDWYGSYGGTVTDPAGPASGSNRVSRGGGWVDYANFCRSAYRDQVYPGIRYFYLGLRVAKWAS
jgi:formylglycine-generating enzyme required for sulfatase activity